MNQTHIEFNMENLDFMLSTSITLFQVLFQVQLAYYRAATRNKCSVLSEQATSIAKPLNSWEFGERCKPPNVVLATEAILMQLRHIFEYFSSGV